MEDPPPTRLDFEHIPHCGRKRELQILQDAFVESCYGDSKNIIIQASSGRGKTALLEAFRSQVHRDSICCSGKFEERTAASEPFSAVVEATTELFDSLAASPQRACWRKRIEDALGAEIVFLEAIFPHMKVLFPDSRTLSSSLRCSSG